MLVNLIPVSVVGDQVVRWFSLKSEYVDRKRNLEKFRFAIVSLAARWLSLTASLAASFGQYCRLNNCGRWLVEACYTFISKSQL